MRTHHCSQDRFCHRGIHIYQAFFALFLLTVCYSGYNVQGAPIYSQTTLAEPIGAFSADVSLTGQKIADNFLLEGSGTSTVRSLRFLGGYGVNSTPPFTPPLNALPLDNFRIVFLEDAANSPGAPLAGGDFLVTSVFARTPTGGPLLNGIFNPIEFVIDLGSGITLNEGSAYWISIGNGPGPNHGWAWARAGGVFGPELASNFSDVTTGPWNVFSSGGMWFELNDHNIPEPSSQVVVVVVIFILALNRDSRSILHQSITKSLS